MDGFEADGAISYTNQDLQEAPDRPVSQDRVRIKRELEDFLRTFSETGSDTFPYRDQLRRNMSRQHDRYTLEIDLEDLAAYKEESAALLRREPDSTLPLFEEAAQKFYFSFMEAEDPAQFKEDISTKPKIQLHIFTTETPQNIRSLVAGHVSKLVTVQGIIISASTVQSKATKLFCRCKTCDDVQEVEVKMGLGGAAIPRKCKASGARGGQPCPMDPYEVDPDQCTFQDIQKLRLQETPENVPTGELPRHIMLASDRALVGAVVPGTRVTVTGVYSVMAPSGRQNDRGGDATSLSQPYLRVVGINIDEEGRNRHRVEFSKAEEEQFQTMSKDPELYDNIGKSIAPAIFGHPDIKKALACSLFAGSVKKLRDGMRIRGDINVLLLGDPSTAKSQLLKFIHQVSPIAVYTSGKGSSAAGLTASVIRGSGREFYLEGGAMVMADGGCVCIDEFDKMRAQDRVAIHEAMEQQTISVAKAGISTVLNSRAAVIAAANPKFGSFDDQKDPTENIEFQSTILSRFDMIFIVLDERNEEKDLTLSKYVMNMHARAATPTQSVQGPISVPTLKRYITYCRNKCMPRLSASAAGLLKDHYVMIRQQLVGGNRDDPDAPPSAIPITVRQLEAIVRISESLAKMRLLNEVHESQVREAIRLFEVSTMAASKCGMLAADMGFIDSATLEEISNCEEQIKRRVPRGDSVSVQNIESELIAAGRSDFAIRKAIDVLTRRGELKYTNQRKFLMRDR
jgi:DNA replication licensing factor MCM5